MKALLIFHLKAGGRVAVRSFAILFSSLLGWIMLGMNPAAVLAGLAVATYARRPSTSDLALIVLLSFLIPFLAAPKLFHGLNGWIRHLAFDSAGNRRGMAVALAAVQIPLALALAFLAWVAHGKGLEIGMPAVRLLLFLASGVLAALPVKRRYLTTPVAMLATWLALQGDWLPLLLAAGLLAVAEVMSGPLRPVRQRRPWRTVDSFLTFRIAWRALGWRVIGICAISLLPLGAAALFLRNNELTPALAAGALRLGGTTSIVLVLSGFVNKLAERRPAWPLARSFPWSSAQRVLADAWFMGAHALLPILILFVRDPAQAACVLSLLPFLALRAAGSIRLVPELLAGARRFLIEGMGLAALLALSPWFSLFGIVAAPLAFFGARRSERALKVTSWSDLHHSALGDTLSWSDS
jgi:hypothetical protein